MEPIPETVDALVEIERTHRAGVLPDLLRKGRLVRDVVPDCLGLSLTMIEHGVTLTLVASDADLALLDALQYGDGGPCVTAVNQGETLETDHGALDEQTWSLFALGAAARGVASTLSLPILDAGRVVGGVNLYGGSRRAFTGHHEELAAILGAWAMGAISNADLSFTTRELARQAPEMLRRSAVVDTAVGALAAVRDIDPATARERLRRAALRAGRPEAEVAELVLELLERSD